MVPRWQWGTRTQRRPLSRFTFSIRSFASPITASAQLGNLQSLSVILQASFRCATPDSSSVDNHGQEGDDDDASGTAGAPSLPLSCCKKTKGAKLSQGDQMIPWGFHFYHHIII